jgi:trehalose 6-phosphate synthase
MSEGDRAAARSSPDGRGRIEALEGSDTYDLRYLELSPDRFGLAYDAIANRVLWFVHHYLWDVPHNPRFDDDTWEAWRAYVEVNEAFAAALDQEATGLDPPPAILVQDYHLALVPRLLRERRPGALVLHFTHTPFAGPDYLRILPDRMRHELLQGMLGADVLGFHVPAWAEAFLLSCRHLPAARVDLRRRTVSFDGRTTLVRDHAIGVDAPALRARARAADVSGHRRELARLRADGRLIVRVDRLELSKNVVRGFEAYAAMLRRRPEWIGRVAFLALLMPSRRGVPEYREYERACTETADRINAELGRDDWQPVRLEIDDDFARSLAAYLEFDVLLVNPVVDGMNLVALEGPAVNRRRGVLVLSRAAGAWARVGRHAIGVNPFDVGETAEALHAALSLPDDERAAMAAALRRAVAAAGPDRWVMAQLADLDRAARPPAVGAGHDRREDQPSSGFSSA